MIKVIMKTTNEIKAVTPSEARDLINTKKAKLYTVNSKKKYQDRKIAPGGVNLDIERKLYSHRQMNARGRSSR